MEIRHRKQFLTGKMVAQVRFGDGDWVDAGYMHRVILNLSNDRLDSAQRLTSWETEAAMHVNKLQADCITRMSKDMHRVSGENETLRSQLSEALNKLRECREGATDVRKVPKKMDTFIVSKHGGYALKIKDSASGEIIYWSESSTEDLMYSNIPTPIRKILAKEGQIPAKYDNDTPTMGEKSGLETIFYVDYTDPIDPSLKQGITSGELRGEELRMVVEAFERTVQESQKNAEECRKKIADAVQKSSESLTKTLNDPNSHLSKTLSKAFGLRSEQPQPIPHHGPGLSEAEDAMRPAGVVGNNQQVLSQEEIAAAFGITPQNILRNDPINPPHYKRGGLESIDVIKAFTENLQGEEAFCTGNALKYLARWKEKGGRQDLEKARWYINRLLGDA